MDDVKELKLTFEAWGEENEVIVTRTKYPYNNNLAITAVMTTGEPFGTFTTNTDVVLPENLAAVDINNMPFIMKVLTENGLAKDTGMRIRSGFVEYPVMKFNLDKIPTIE